MKTIVLGDIHGRTIWKDIVRENYNADRFIFLGDYVSTHERGMSDEQQISNLVDIIEFAIDENSKSPGRVILLRGNHDMQHLNYYWAQCSGYFRNVASWMESYKEKFLANTQWLFVDGSIVYSHAGLTTTWMERNNLTSPEQVNELEPSEKFAFTPCKFSDYYGDSKTQPPTWVRPWTLFENSFGSYTYIVGHTTTKIVTDIKQEILDTEWGKDMYEQFKDKNQVWSCDCLGNGEYIIVDDDEIIPCKI